MTDNVTAAVPPPPVAGTPRRYTESLSLFVDPATRAYTRGRAVELATENGWKTPRESEVLRALIDEGIRQAYADDPEAYEATVALGRAELGRRADQQG